VRRSLAAAALVLAIASGPARAADEGKGGDFLKGVLEGARILTEPGPPPTREQSAELWDAFLTVVSKRAAQESEEPELRQDFFGALVQGRFDVVKLLGSDAGDDVAPLRRLFESAWPRLAPLLERLAATLPRDAGARWRGLLDAGRVLDEISKSGGAVASELAARGLTPDRLRQLARLVLPPELGDPLVYDTAVDPALREVFGFGAPIALAAAYARRDERAPLDWLIPAAHAADAPAGDVAALSARLAGWAPTRKDVGEYLPLVHRLLHALADRTLAAKPLEPAYHELYDDLLLATAWQESCWRQFVKNEQGKATPIQSGVGSVGLMQINQKVWRGFYDVAGLQQDIAYNGAAGAEILRHYLRDYAIRRGDPADVASLESLARSTYAIYNGGPGHIRRWRNPKARKDLREIDAAFLEKFRAVEAGDEMGVARCYDGRG
jgi:hypothetical protein